MPFDLVPRGAAPSEGNFDLVPRTPGGSVAKPRLGPNANAPSLAEKVIAPYEKFAEGYTAGFGPKVEAGIATAPAAVEGKPIGEEYKANLQNIDERMAEFSKEHPVIAGNTEVAGALANPLGRRGLNPSSLEAALTIPGMTRNTLTGAAFGGAQAAGESRGDLGETAGAVKSGAEKGAVFGLLGPIAARGVQKAAMAVKEGHNIAKSSLSTGAQTAAKELASQGIDVSYMTKVPEAAKGMVRGYFANTLVGGIPIRSAAARVGRQVNEALDTTVDRVGKALDAAGAGEKVHKGLEVATRAFKAKAAGLYDKADTLISPAGMPMQVKTDNIKAVLAENNTALQGLELEKTLGNADTDKVSKEILSGLKEASKKGRMTYDTLKASRSAVGEKISNTPFNDPMQKYWKRVYSGLTEDMTAAAKAAGPAAHAATVSANEFYKAGRGELEKLVSRYGSKVETENAFRAVSSMDTLRNAPARVATLFQNLPTSARKTVGATVIKRLGQTADGSDVNAGQWANNWQKIAPAARRTLAGSDEATAELDKLSRNIQRTKPLTQTAAETGIQTAGRLSDIAAAVNILNPVMWPVAIGKVVMDVAGGWFLAHPREIAAMNEVIESGDRIKGASLLRKASDYALDDAHKQMMLNAADFLVRNRNGVIGLAVGDGQK